MRHIIIISLLILLSATTHSLIGQNVECTRVANLHDGEYDMEGTAFLEQLDNNNIQIRLSEDFKTEVGPDIQLFLSNDSTSIEAALRIANISRDQVQGALTLPVSGIVDINEYEYVIFRCVLFRAYWGGGTLMDSSCSSSNDNNDNEEDTNPMDSVVTMACVESIVATTNWASEVTICPNDEQDDIVTLMNNAFVPAGDNYAYIFANENNQITRVHLEDSYNFEGSSLETEHIFGVSYDGTLVYNLGESINSIAADNCAILSSTTTFLRVFKEDCRVDSFECLESATATTGWATAIDICPNDGQADEVAFLNNAFEEPSDGHYSYIITDSLDIIMVVVNSSSYDFEGSELSAQRVYGVSFDENLSAVVGQHISTITADGCAILSDTESLFLTVSKSACNVAPDNDMNISGRITAPGRGGIRGVDVTLSNGMTTTTNADGVYSFSNLTSGSYTITPSTDARAGNGLSSTDLVLTARHILGLTLFDNVYQIISADTNNSNTISATDLVQMRLVILGRLNTFSSNSSWVFLDIADDLTGTTLPSNISETITVTLDTSDVTDANFTGVKIGDLNGNAGLDLR